MLMDRLLAPKEEDMADEDEEEEEATEAVEEKVLAERGAKGMPGLLVSM